MTLKRNCLSLTLDYIQSIENLYYVYCMCLRWAEKPEIVITIVKGQSTWESRLYREGKEEHKWCTVKVRFLNYLNCLHCACRPSKYKIVCIVFSESYCFTLHLMIKILSFMIKFENLATSRSPIGQWCNSHSFNSLYSYILIYAYPYSFLYIINLYSSYIYIYITIFIQ